MAKRKRTVESVELTLSTDYVKDWKVQHGIREFVQNALDAQRVGRAGMRIEYDEALLSLLIETTGTRLELKTLLLGVSEKGGDDAVGRFGEGYKVGCIALIRDGKSVRIRTGTQVWTPKFERSDRFGVPTLTFDIEEGHEDVEAVCVTIQGLRPEEWTEHRKMFRATGDFSDVSEVRMIPRYSWEQETGLPAAILFDESQRGRVYVGGIYVANMELGYGYDLPPAMMKLDRDRNNLREWEAKRVIQAAWQALYVRAVESGDRGAATMAWTQIGSSQDKDFEELEADPCAKFVEVVAAEFRREHGDAYPVHEHEMMKRAQVLGLKPVTVPKRIQKVLAGLYPKIPDVEKKEQQRVLESFSIESLTPSEAARLRWAWGLVLGAGAKVLKDLPAVDVLDPQAAVFASNLIYGIHAVDSRQVFVARWLLGDFGKLIVTCVHEYLHFAHEQHGTKMDHATEWMFQEIFNALAGDEGDGEPMKAPPPDEKPDLPF